MVKRKQERIYSRFQEQERIYSRLKEMESEFHPQKEEVKDPVKMENANVSAEISEKNNVSADISEENLDYAAAYTEFKLKYRNLQINFQQLHSKSFKDKYGLRDDWFKVNEVRLLWRFRGWGFCLYIVVIITLLVLFAICISS
jgi:hypothetical protein